MILNFRPSDMNTFRATFNLHKLEIHKQRDNSWKLYVNNLEVRNGHYDTARRCMSYAEGVAARVINKRIGRVN